MIVRSPGHQVTRTPRLQKAVRCISGAAAGAAVIFWAAVCCAQPVSSAELITRAAAYDGKSVEYQGEVIGDVMVRGDYAWVNLLDGASALGVWMRAQDARTIAYSGTYLVRGDTIKVTGTFHRSCLQHGGDLDLHAEAVTQVASGARFAEEPPAAKAKMALGLAMILGVVWTSGILKKR